MAGNVASECSETTVEIKIMMMDSQTFTLRVDKCVPVPQLKEQIASLTGVVSEQQRLICRGKVLNDDQLLSAYHVEDGHTLHLVVRQPVAPTPELFDHPETDPTSSDGHNPHVMVGTFDLSEQGDGAFPDLNRIVSAVLGSFRLARSGIGSEGIDLNHLPLASTAPDLSGTRNSSRVPSDQAALPVDSLQPPIIPDSLTTLLQYSRHLCQDFSAYAGGHSANEQNAGFFGSEGAASGSEGAAAVHFSEPRGLLRPESLAEVMSSARQVLGEQATVCLSQFARQLESHSTVMDPLERSRIQSNAMRLGVLFQNLGAMLLELGRTIISLRMGQTPADALVNAGPALFVSSTGPNPIMVQPLPFQPGASFGPVPVETVQSGSGGSAAATAGFQPRNIDIRIRTGSSFTSRREPTASSQPVEQGGAAAVAVDPNSQQARVAAALAAAVPTLRPVSIGRSSDSSRGSSSIGIVYPVLARVQHVASSPGIRASGRHNGNTGQPVAAPTDSASEHRPNFFVFPSGGNGGNGTSLPTSEALPNDLRGLSGNMRSGLDQLLSTLYPGEHFFTGNSAAAAVAQGGSAPAVPSHTTQEAAQDTRESASASGVSDEGIMLSNILRHIMPIITSQNTNTTTNEDAQTQADDGNNPDLASTSCHHQPGPQSQQPDSKRQRHLVILSQPLHSFTVASYHPSFLIQKGEMNGYRLFYVHVL